VSTPPFQPPPDLIIGRTEHWIVNHRVGAKLPGYLMIGLRHATISLGDVPPEALGELGGVMAAVQQAVQEILAPEQIHIARYGHMGGHSFHFHVIPVCAWLQHAFLADARYRVLDSFNTPDAERSPIDGAELTLYVWRELCESRTPAPVEGPSVEETIRNLRRWLRANADKRVHLKVQ
jgi:diadenosine tetraphosphate (Ap4A) HIT family hydrolase